MTRGGITVGVVGVGRGMSFARQAKSAGMRLVALCDMWKEKLDRAGKEMNVPTYTDYDEFLAIEMDAVILANYFHEHVPLAIRALKGGKHVMSETAACHTLEEGVALVRAVERSGRIYMFAENYPYMLHNQEMRRLYREGVIGDFLYGEGEYVHPMIARERNWLSPGIDHWRNWIPATYYCTHSIAPVMYITDTRPVRVNGFVVPYDFKDPTLTMTTHVGDTAGLIICRMDNGAYMKSLHGGLRGHGVFVRIHGNKGLMENCRIGNRNMVRLQREPFDKNMGEPEEKVYLPDFPIHHEEAVRAGHGGGDFFTTYHFAESIRRGEQPYLNVYRAVDMSIVGILAYKSALTGSVPLDVPDLRNESDRKRYEDDDWSPDPSRKKPDQPLPSVLGHIEPSEAAVRFAKEIWRDMGYRGE